MKGVLITPELEIAELSQLTVGIASLRSIFVSSRQAERGAATFSLCQEYLSDLNDLFTPGEHVAIHGLARHPSLNGTIGIFDSVDPDTQRCVVCLPLGEQALLKPINLQMAKKEQRSCALRIGYCAVCHVGDAHPIDSGCLYCGASPVAKAAAAASL